MSIKCLLWDFGDTLVDEDWMLQNPEGVPEWKEVWTSIARGELAELWYLGQVGVGDIIRALEPNLPMSLKAIEEHIISCCRSIRFFSAVWEIVRKIDLPQAIVTVNPDIFSTIVVPYYQLDENFSVIVTSWEEGVLDKGLMCKHALELLGDSLNPEEVLLIDNKEENIIAWKECGGHGYLFHGEEEFNNDFEKMIDG